MLHLLFMLFVLFLALSFFGISIQHIIESPAGQQNLIYLHQLFDLAWAWIIAHVQ